MTRTLLVLLMTASVAGAQEGAGPGSAVPDSLTHGQVTHGKVTHGSVTRAVQEYPWGGVPARTPANTTKLINPARPGWEKAAMVPYHLAGLPFRFLNYVGHQGLEAADRLGFFGLPPAEHLGLRLPLDLYLMPEFGISGLEGTAFGLNLTRYDFLGPDNRLFLSASTSSCKADKVSGGALLNLGAKSDLQLGAGLSHLPLTKYYGLGPTSEPDNLSYYTRRSWWGGAELDHDLGRGLDLEIRSFYSGVEANPSRFEVENGLGVVHEGDFPPGYPGLSRGWTWRLGLVRNNAPETGRPQSGGLQKASVSFFQAVDGSDLEYLTYTLDVQHFFPLWHTKRTLGARFFFNRIENRSDTEVPLTRLVTFSRPDELRGFSSLRFYGLGSIGFNTEYRWPVWVSRGRDGPGLDTYLFSDFGQVFNDTSELNFENFEWTGGVGLRFIDGSQGFMGRFELGFSNEETVVTLKFSQNFQYDGKGMLGGKDPTRRR